ncbi:MAG: ATP-grasp domain-containing protein [Pyrinomonadaceae bacterium]
MENKQSPFNLVCIASDFKGNPFIEAAKRRGCHVTLVTKSKHVGDAWLRDSIDEFHTVGDSSTSEDYLRTVVWLARHSRVDHVVGLDEFDVLPAAQTREFLGINRGLKTSEAMVFRDKLTMRFAARRAGIAEPDFVPLFNSENIVKFAESVSPPWIIKPRTEVSAFGIRKIYDSGELWANITELDSRQKWRDHSSQFLLEKFVPGKVFHIDSLVWDNAPLFSGVSNYGTPPLNVTHQGGVFTTSLLDYDCEERRELLELNKKLIAAFGIKQGVTHAEFLQADEDGKFYLLEVAARVGGAYIADALEAASGINLWAEWANIELCDSENPYQLPATHSDYAGVVLSLANQQEPDTTAYTEDEIVYRIKKANHVGFVVKSSDRDRVQNLLAEYSARFIKDFTITAPPRERHDL